MLTRKELAEALGVTRQALHQWEQQGADVEGVLALPLDEAVWRLQDWRAQNLRPTYKDATEPKADGTPQEQLLAAQIRKTNAEAEAKELKNAVARAELTDTSQVELEVAELTSMVRARLEAIPQQVENELPAEVRAVVGERVRELVFLILTEMSQWKLGSG